MPPFQQSLSDKANYQEFEGEISYVLNSALIEHDLPLARAWVPCVLNRKCLDRRLGLHPNSVFVLDVKWGNTLYVWAHKDLASTFFHMEKGEGIVGKAFMTNQAFLSPEAALSSNPRDPLCDIARRYGFFNAAIAVPLQSIIDNSECVFEFFFPLNCKHLEEQKKIATALFSTLKQCCRTLRVVADKVLEEPSNSTFLAFPSPQPFDTVEQSVAKDSLIQKENPREADPKRVMQLLPESSNQNERCPDPTPRIEPAKKCDAIGLGSLAASEERHATGEKTVNVPNISLNDSAKSTGGK
ncbi:hypothetical protein TIFTF001_027108 [Ficus carica]|uniref:NLP1-9 GAF domain-containing protein n=1 Tax=Ficus carica TaxID=3494 RepID=A0AA88DME6_FICCA|nr:hypothetical protein TIFTF001_027108 [Ficus carica]